ncbi:MAG: NUDIX hydrolase [Burkholderiales bacterium]|nr:NUDIX hydrolase [Burkholderiales bacterium]MDE2287605.1 NUDIX hydrolase [Burkholderiales bacterium]
MPDIHSHERGLIETRIDGETLFEGNFLTLKRDRVRLPDGKEATREFLEHPGAVMVIPLFDDGQVLMERQFRYPLRQVMCEFPAGKLDADESPLFCAQRELLEETGYSAGRWQRITRIHPVISYSTEFIDIFLARDLSAGQRQLDDGEFLETFTMPATQLLDWVRCGQVSDVKTVIGAFWLEKILGGQWSPEPDAG